MRRKKSKQRLSKKRPRNSPLLRGGCGGYSGSHGGFFTDYPVKVGKNGKPYANGQKDKGISFWKIPGWREGVKTG
jgi:hypothetical protein